MSIRIDLGFENFVTVNALGPSIILGVEPSEESDKGSCAEVTLTVGEAESLAAILTEYARQWNQKE